MIYAEEFHSLRLEALVEKLQDDEAVPASCPARQVYKIGVTGNAAILFKFYGMIKQGEPELPKMIVNAREKFLVQKLASREIKSRTGAGFAILSNNGASLTVSVWGVDSYPHILRVYGYRGCSAEQMRKDHIKSEKAEEMERVDIQDKGVYCMWEIDVARHESRAWREYLQSFQRSSGRANSLQKYFDDFYEGQLL